MFMQLTKSEKRERKQKKQRYAPKGGTLGGVNVKIQVSRGFLKKRRSVV